MHQLLLITLLLTLLQTLNSQTFNGLPDQIVAPTSYVDCKLMVMKVNVFRQQYNLPPLTVNPTLSLAAELHSQDQSDHHELTHIGSDNANLAVRVDRQNYSWLSIGENVGFGFDSMDQVMIAWINSPGHRANLLGDYKEMGCGYINSYWTQDFGTPL